MSYALLSVFDKTGIVEFAKILHLAGYKIISTGGTAHELTKNGVPIIPIQDVTGNPESFDGRMKTISFQIESGILFDRTNKRHLAEAKKLKIKPIDIVVCNLYPFESKPTIENIDVGGPTMIRAAAKNFKNVLVLTDPGDYGAVSKAIVAKKISQPLRKKLAGKAFSHLSFYDSQIAEFLITDKFPQYVTLPGRLTSHLRYGENPHQEAALYLKPRSQSPLSKLKKLSGRDLSYVNLTDIIAGLESVAIFKEPAAAVIKHNSPCGIALGRTTAGALSSAIEADPVSAFGGVIILNRPLDLKTARVIAAFKSSRRGQFDIIAAPGADEKAINLLKEVRKTTGIYQFGSISPKRSSGRYLKPFDGGFILQDWDDEIEGQFKRWQVVTKKKPPKEQLIQMKIAWKFITRIRSNAVIIVDAKLPMTRGIGSGQTSRVASAQIAIKQAGKYTKGGILASDSFFPFDDCVKLAARHQVAAIVQQGGSVNDQSSIEAADRAGIPMVFTGRRAFSH